jgi:hypothetical protein
MDLSASCQPCRTRRQQSTVDCPRKGNTTRNLPAIILLLLLPPHLAVPQHDFKTPMNVVVPRDPHLTVYGYGRKP